VDSLGAVSSRGAKKSHAPKFHLHINSRGGHRRGGISQCLQHRLDGGPALLQHREPQWVSWLGGAFYLLWFEDLGETARPCPYIGHGLGFAVPARAPHPLLLRADAKWRRNRSTYTGDEVASFHWRPLGTEEATYTVRSLR